MKKIIPLFICLLFSSPIEATFETPIDPRPIHKLTPPDLSTAHLGEQIICYRPMREGAPRMGYEEVDGRHVFHNYGHGGSGITLAPGAAAYVVDLWEKVRIQSHLSLDTPLTILGAGIIGFSTAYTLCERGYTNLTIIAEKYDNLTSHNAGGLIAPVSMSNNPEMQPLIDDMGVKAYRFYQGIIDGTNTRLRKGVQRVPGYWRTREDSGLEPYVEAKVMDKAEDVIVDFGNGATRAMVVYKQAIFVDPLIMMDCLKEYLYARPINWVQEKIRNFQEVEDTFIFNCTGLGAKVLNRDADVISVQGHLISLKNQPMDKLQYMVLDYLPERKTTTGQSIIPSVYLFPKGVGGILGGTFIHGATPATPHIEEFNLMLENARQFFGWRSGN